MVATNIMVMITFNKIHDIKSAFPRRSLYISSIRRCKRVSLWNAVPIFKDMTSSIFKENNANDVLVRQMSRTHDEHDFLQLGEPRGGYRYRFCGVFFMSRELSENIWSQVIKLCICKFRLATKNNKKEICLNTTNL